MSEHPRSPTRPLVSRNLFGPDGDLWATFYGPSDTLGADAAASASASVLAEVHGYPDCDGAYGEVGPDGHWTVRGLCICASAGKCGVCMERRIRAAREHGERDPLDVAKAAREEHER